MNYGPYTQQVMNTPNTSSIYSANFGMGADYGRQNEIYRAQRRDLISGWGTSPQVGGGGGGGGGAVATSAPHEVMNAQLKRDLFDQLFGGGGGAGAGAGAGTSSFQGNVNFADNLAQVQQGAPQIGAAPVLSEQQIQERVNQMRARGDLSTAGIVQRLGDQLSGAGFGGNSPLLQQLAAQAQFQNLATSAAGENDLRYQAALGNAEHLLAAQQAAAAADNQQRGLAVDLSSQRNQLIAALLGALG